MTVGRVKLVSRAPTEEEKFWAKYDKNGPLILDTPCWEWRLARDKDGYGLVDWEGRKQGAHIVAYRLGNGELPEGHLVMHKCDHPPCGNPEHLGHGTNAENLADMAEKGRARGGRRTKDGQEPKNRRA